MPFHQGKSRSAKEKIAPPFIEKCFAGKLRQNNSALSLAPKDHEHHEQSCTKEITGNGAIGESAKGGGWRLRISQFSIHFYMKLVFIYLFLIPRRLHAYCHEGLNAGAASSVISVITRDLQSLISLTKVLDLCSKNRIFVPTPPVSMLNESQSGVFHADLGKE